jgi:hypothetical protein
LNERVILDLWSTGNSGVSAILKQPQGDENLNTDNHINWISLVTIAVLIVYPFLVIWLSRRWYQRQSQGQTINDVVYIGKNHSSPILTILFRFSKSITYSLVLLKKSIISGAYWIKKIFRFLGIRIINLIIHELPRKLISSYQRFTVIWLKIKRKILFKFVNSAGNSINNATPTSRIEKEDPDLIRNKGVSSFIEIFLIILWAIFVGRDCLNFSPNKIMVGNEYTLVIQSHFAWTVLPKCGDCMLWNGFVNGGAPSFVDTHGAILHPLVAICTLALGVIKGAQVVILFSLALAGIAQWWLARVMGLGRFARIWAAFLVVIGGHLAGKMENGNVMLMLSTASASFLLAAMYDLVRTRRRSSLIWSGIALSLLIVSGQGYIQIGMGIAVLPAFSLLLFDRNTHLKPVWKDVTLAVLLGFLLAGIFLVPLFHFLPNIYKDANPAFSNNQPLQYLPLNLVIHDRDFFLTSVLGHDTNLYLNYIYIGWFPVIFAILAVPLFGRKKFGTILFFLICIAQIFILSCKEFANLIAPIIPQFALLRWGSIFSGLSVPLIIGLAAMSLDYILHAKWWPKLEFGVSGLRTFSFSLSILLVFIPSIACMISPYQENRAWLTYRDFYINRSVVQDMATPSSQWVYPGIHDYLWTRALLEQGAKLTGIWRPWFWKDHEGPLPYKSFAYTFENDDHKDVYAVYNEIEVMIHDKNQYSYITSGDHVTPCPSNATGGLIKTTCQNENAGTLVVEENQWEGWTATMDGSPVELIPGTFLSVQAPVGTHTYEFRYKPWDVWVGLGVTILGIVFALYLRYWAPKEL